MKIKEMTAPQFAFFSMFGLLENDGAKKVRLLNGCCRMCGGRLFRINGKLLDAPDNLRRLLEEPAEHKALFSDNWTREDVAVNKNSVFDCPACVWTYLASDKKNNKKKFNYPWDELPSGNALFTKNGMSLLTKNQMLEFLCYPREVPFVAVVARGSGNRFWFQYVLWHAEIAFDAREFPVAMQHNLFDNLIREQAWVRPAVLSKIVNRTARPDVYKSTVHRLASLLKQ